MMTVFNKHKYKNVPLPNETHQLVKHIAKGLGVPLHAAIATGIRLLQEKLEITDPPRSE